MEQLPEGNLFRFPAANNAFMLTFYQNSAARAAAQEENLKPEGYEATFDCIACTLVTNGEIYKNLIKNEIVLKSIE